MTSFQLLVSVVFVGLLAAAYRKDIFDWVKNRLPKLPIPVPVSTSGVQDLVDDLVTVATLRDKFAKTGCKEGEDACSILLKIIVDHKHPHAG